MKAVQTKDGSITFYNEEYAETYHSTTGAAEEALKKFILASEPERFADKESVRILDVCFGLGYNSAAAIDEILKINPFCMIEVIALEKDENILSKIESVDSGFESYAKIKKAAIDKEYSDERITIKIIIGDAMHTVNFLSGEFDLIFHDPFSPKKNPEAWTEDFFKELRKHISKEGVLTTYSCARIVRDNLKKAGFNVADGPCVGRRAPSTIAKPS